MAMIFILYFYNANIAKVFILTEREQSFEGYKTEIRFTTVSVPATIFRK